MTKRIRVEKGVTLVSCGNCSQYLPRSSFHRKKHSAVGLDFRCKKCKSAYKREYYKKHYERPRKKRLTQEVDGIVKYNCLVCNEWLPSSNYYAIKENTCGLMGKCKICFQKQQKEYRLRKFGPPKPRKTKPSKIIDGITVYLCTKCKEYKQRDEFVKKTGGVGITCACKLCINEYARAYRRKRKVRQLTEDEIRKYIQGDINIRGKGSPLREMREENGVILYKCSFCHKFFPREGFWKDNGTLLGLRSMCIACNKDAYYKRLN